MAFEDQPPPRDRARAPTTVRMGRNGRGIWEIAMPDGRESFTCETFGDARRAAYLCATRACPCELIVRDAYGRVVQRELIDCDHEARQALRGRLSEEPVDLSVRT